MGPLAAALIPAAVGAVAGFAGGERQNRQNLKIMREQNRFSERMRNTQWQAGVADMEAAGLNPALAYSKGGAASPTGAGTQAVDTVSSALQAMQQRKQLQLLEAQAQKTRAEAKGAKADAQLKADRTDYLSRRGRLLDKDGKVLHQSVPLWYDMIDSEVASARAGATNLKALSERNHELARIARPMGDISERFGEFTPLLGALLAPGGAGIRAGSAAAKATKRALLTRKIQRRIRR